MAEEAQDELTALIRAIERKATEFTANPVSAAWRGYFRDAPPDSPATAGVARPSVRAEYAAWLRTVAARDLAGRPYRFEEDPEAPGGVRLVIV